MCLRKLQFEFFFFSLFFVMFFGVVECTRLDAYLSRRFIVRSVEKRVQGLEFSIPPIDFCFLRC